MIDWTKPVKTREGRDVRIYAVDGGGNYPVHGACKNGAVWTPQSWAADGFYCHLGVDNPLDLVQTPETREVDFWVNVYETGLELCPHKTKEAADSYQDKSRGRFACLHVQAVVKRGEGL